MCAWRESRSDINGKCHRRRHRSHESHEEYIYMHIHIQTHTYTGGNREAKSMGNTTHRRHRSHTAHKGHRRESRSKINVELLFKDVQVPNVPGGHHEAKSMVGVVVLAGPFPQGMLDFLFEQKMLAGFAAAVW